jgi:hypothetical protein
MPQNRLPIPSSPNRVKRIVAGSPQPRRRQSADFTPGGTSCIKEAGGSFRRGQKYSKSDALTGRGTAMSRSSNARKVSEAFWFAKGRNCQGLVSGEKSIGRTNTLSPGDPIQHLTISGHGIQCQVEKLRACTSPPYPSESFIL